MKAQLRKGVRIRPEEFGGVVQIRNVGAFQVDPIGFTILSQIENGIKIDEIISSMKEKYDDSPQIEEDIHKFIQKLVKEGVIELEQ
ncbi:MAG: PqqD family protein [Theionarchaea archaeon]|nr:PqqD family protein [Theionarchaea archaeon]